MAAVHVASLCRGLQLKPCDFSIPLLEVPIPMNQFRRCEQSEAIHDLRMHGSPRFARDDSSWHISGIRPDSGHLQ